MTTQWETVHIFISSTFNDMHAERDHLVKKVFPQLREWCEKRKLRLVDIDLRWGVTEADATTRNVVKICLDRIDDCRPFFLCFLGQRRGWVPKEEQISPATFDDFPGLKELAGVTSVTEMEIFHALVNPLHRGRVHDPKKPGEFYEASKYAFFYLRDNSYLDHLPADPPLLRQTYTNDGVKNAKERKLQDQELAEWRERKIPGTGRPVRKYQAQWNEKLRTPELLMPLKCPSVDEKAIQDWQEAWERAGVTVRGVDVEADPTEADKAHSYNRMLSSGRLSDFQTEDGPLSWVIVEDLQKAITARYPDHYEVIGETELQKELDQQEYYLYSGSQGFIERGGDFDELDAYVDGDSRQLFVLTAPAGMGKSSLLAKWVERYQNEIEGKVGVSIHFRFIGQSDRSTTVHSLLHLMLRELKEVNHKISEEIPDDPQKLRQELPKLLESAGKRGRTVIVIDGLNQLESGLTDLSWLPYKLPQNIRLIVSFKRGEVEAESLLNRMQGQVILSEVRPFDNPGDRQSLVDKYLDQYLKQLDRPLVEALIQSPGASNPLYLKVVLSELRVFGAFGNLDEKIRSDFGETPLSAFNAVLKRLETDPAYSTLDSVEAVPLVFGLLAHARQGLSVEELVSLLIQALKLVDESSRQAVADTVYLYLRQVRPFLAQREGRYDFFFESFKLAARQRYAGDQVRQRTTEAWHRLLAHYFGALPTWQPDGKPSLHKIADLPYHQLPGKLWDDLSNTLTDFDFLEAKCRFFSVGELELEYREALASWQGDSTQKHVLVAFEEYLRVENHHIQKYSELLFPKMYNHLTRLHPPDDPVHVVCEKASSLHHGWLREPQDSFEKPTTFISMGLKGEVCVLDVALTPDGQFAITASGGETVDVWDLSSNCLLSTLKGHEGVVLAAALTPDGKQIISGSSDMTLKLWDLVSGCLIRTITGHKGDVKWVAVTPDGQQIISGSGDTSIKVWDLASGRMLRSLGGDIDQLICERLLRTHEADIDQVTALTITPDGQHIISGSSKSARGNYSWTENIIKVWHLTRGELLRTMQGSNEVVNTLAVTPDGQQIISGSDDKTLRVWDLISGKLLITLKGEGHTNRVNTVCITPDGKQIISGASDKTLKVWDLAYGSLLQTLKGHNAAVMKVKVTPDGQRIVSGSGDALKVWDLNSGRLLRTIQGDWHTNDVHSVAAAPDGRHIISGSWDGTIKVWDLESRRLLHTLEGHTGWVNAVAVSPDSRLIISGSQDDTLKVWDLASGELLHTLVGHEGAVTAAVVTPNGYQLISQADDKTIKMWDLGSGQLLRTLEGATSGWLITALAVAPDSRHVVSGSSDETIKIWDLNSGELLHTLKGHKEPVTCVAVSPDGQKIVSGSHDYSVKVWNLINGKLLRSLKGHSDLVSAVAVFPDGQRIVSGSRDKTLKVWDIATGQLLDTLRGHTEWVNAVAVTPDSKHVISGGSDHLVLNWDLAGSLNLPDGHREAVNAVALTPDDKTLVTGSSDNTIKIWDLASGRLLRSLDGHTYKVNTIVLTPDGKKVISGSKDATLKVWNLEDGKLIYSMKERRGEVNSLAVTPDGKMALSGSSDTVNIQDIHATERIAIKVWDLSSGKLMHTIQGHNGVVFCLAVTPDGQKVISSGFSRCIKVWNLTSAELQKDRGFGDDNQTTLITDGNYIISGSYSGMIYVQDMDCRIVRVLEGHTARVNALVLTPDGQQVISCSEDQTIKKWDLTSGKSRTLNAKEVSTKCICLSRDAHWLICGEASGSVQVYEWVH